MPWVGSVSTAVQPLLNLVEAHVMAAARLHADDATVLDLRLGRPTIWGAGPPAAMFYYSRDRKRERPQGHLARYAGIPRADAYDGYNQLYMAGRQPRRSGRLPLGRMEGVRSLPWPTSKRMPGAKLPATRKSLCLRSRSRWCVASMCYLRSSGPSMARAPRSVFRYGRR